MAITVADNFSYQGKKPLDGRDTFTTLAAMKAYAEASVYDGCLSYCDEDGKRYEFKSTNTVDPTTGKWREYSSGGGGQTYNDFTGATASTAGAHGLVPAPSAGDEGKVLFGNGLWGALPSVDLSVLSNEAFIFSATEKPVGMWTDRKLLYSKVVELRTPTATRTDYVGFEQSGIDIKFTNIWFFEYETGLLFTGMHSGQLNWTIRNNGTKIYTWTSENAYLNKVGRVAIFYTKTTDSPLPSDVKFAGVTSTGEVIYEKNLLVPFAQSVAHGITNIGSYRRIADCGFILPDGVSYSPCYASPTLFVFPSGFTGTVVEFLYGTGWASTFQNIRLKLHFTLAS